MLPCVLGYLFPCSLGGVAIHSFPYKVLMVPWFFRILLADVSCCTINIIIIETAHQGSLKLIKLVEP